MRRTKIIATLGPATSNQATIESIIHAGVDVVRLNFSHGTREQHMQTAQIVRSTAQKLNRSVGILVDLQGPKIRIERFKAGQVHLSEGQSFIIDTQLDRNSGDETRVGVAYPELAHDVKPDNLLLLDDGRLSLRVKKVDGHEIHTVVETGGELKDKKGINLQGGGLSAPALTEKDKQDILIAAEIQTNYLAVSFPRNADDIQEARQLIAEAGGGEPGIIAKIERAEALEKVTEIFQASDAVMIARGDLGVEIGDAQLPAVQKRLISIARDMNRVVITATQMMESMIENSMPTRAEVFDVANAVLDGTDAVMLSAETAVGKYPAKVVSAMSRICEGAERERQAKESSHRLNTEFERIDETIALSTMYAANHLKVRAIAALTESGSTPLTMSRISSGIPIYAITRHEQTVGKCALYRGVYPVLMKEVQTDHARANKAVVDILKQNGAVQEGDIVIITKGDLVGVHGGTNAIKIVKVGELVEPRDG